MELSPDSGLYYEPDFGPYYEPDFGPDHPLAEHFFNPFKWVEEVVKDVKNFVTPKKTEHYTDHIVKKDYHIRKTSSDGADTIVKNVLNPALLDELKNNPDFILQVLCNMLFKVTPEVKGKLIIPDAPGINTAGYFLSYEDGFKKLCPTTDPIPSVPRILFTPKIETNAVELCATVMPYINAETRKLILEKWYIYSDNRAQQAHVVLNEATATIDISIDNSAMYATETPEFLLLKGAVDA